MDIVKAVAGSAGLLDKLALVEKEPLPDAPILSAKIKLLSQCNLSCVFCSLPKPSKPMPGAKVAEILRSLKKRGLLKIHFSGGEAFLHPEIMEIIEDSVNLGLQVNLTTNGTLITKDAARRLVKTGVHSISISLDGATAKSHDKIRGVKGAFKSTVKAIRFLSKMAKRRPVIRVNTVVTSENVKELGAIHSLLESISEKIRWKLIPVDTPDDGLRASPEAIKKMMDSASGWRLLDAPPFRAKAETMDAGRLSAAARGDYGTAIRRGRMCYAPWLTVFMDALGRAYPCCMARARVPSYGNVNLEPVNAILDGENAKIARMNMASGLAPAICAKCDDFVAENAAIGRLARKRRLAEKRASETNHGRMK